MKKTSKQTDHDKKLIAALVVLNGETIKGVADKYEIPVETLEQWVQGFQEVQIAADSTAINAETEADDYKALYENERRKRLEAAEDKVLLKKLRDVVKRQEE